MWERGLKHGEVCRRIAEHGVAPRVGAWIETPRMEETAMRNGSLPVWERGLKPPIRIELSELGGRSPCGSVD